MSEKLHFMAVCWLGLQREWKAQLLGLWPSDVLAIHELANKIKRQARREGLVAVFCVEFVGDSGLHFTRGGARVW